jgi:hypothetical protein
VARACERGGRLAWPGVASGSLLAKTPLTLLHKARGASGADRHAADPSDESLEPFLGAVAAGEPPGNTDVVLGRKFCGRDCARFEGSEERNVVHRSQTSDKRDEHDMTVSYYTIWMK